MPAHTKKAPIKRPMTIPIEYSGKWIVMDRERTRIVAQADELPELLRLVEAHAPRSVVLYKVPRADRITVGGA